MPRAASVSTGRLQLGCVAVLGVAFLALACTGNTATPTAPSPTPQAQPGVGPSGQSGTSVMSLPVSPSVVATVATTGDRLSLLVLWRGTAGWYSPSGQHSESARGGQFGLLSVTLDYGRNSVDLALDPLQHTAVVQGKAARLPPDANVLLVDGVDTPDRGGLVKALFVDPANVNVHLISGMSADTLFGNLAQLFGRSAEVVAFLQCDAAAADSSTIDVCSFVGKR